MMLLVYLVMIVAVAVGVVITFIDLAKPLPPASKPIRNTKPKHE